MRLLIVEEALKDRRGHWYEYNRAIVTEARRRGIDTTLLAHSDLQADLRSELGAEPYFPTTSWDGGYFHPSAWRRYGGILRHNLLVARLMGRFFEKSGPFDVILVPTVVLYHWLAWRWLAWRGRGRWFRKLVLTTRNNAGEYDASTRRYVFKSSAGVLKRVVRSFRGPVRRGEVELASDSEVIAKQYEALCGLPFSTYPHPVEDGAMPPRANTSGAAASLTFGALGPPRYEKGSDLVIEAIRIVRRSSAGKSLRFLVQWTGDCHDPEGRRVLPNADLQGDEGVTLITSDLSSGEYRQRLAQCDALLLPYRRDQYHARLSGVAIEAFRCGIPCICISDTWIADSMSRIGAGLAIEEESAAALAKAILELAADYRHHSEMARNRAAAARAFHSSRGFVDKLLGAGNAS